MQAVTEQDFKRILKSQGISESFADKLWQKRDESIENATEKEIIAACDEWRVYEQFLYL